ncbi:MAG: hypothetical protein [Microvirus sp.]|nr:MAG: hypothetical protein [Microvirus sp.]
MKRHHMSRAGSRGNFRHGTHVHKKNLAMKPERGGWRL